MGYHRPASLAQGLDLLAHHELTIVAGATDVYPAQTTRRAWGDWRPAQWLDIGGLQELRGIVDAGDQYRIGALTTWTDLVREPLPACFDALKQAARSIGGPQIQNRATVVGNICNASPAADGVPALLCLDAQVEIASASSTRVLALDAFLQGNRQTAIRGDELVSALIVPKLAASARSRFEKLGAREYLVISIVMAAGVLDIDAAGRIGDVRIAVGACSPVAQRLGALETHLRGQPCHPRVADSIGADHFAGLDPIDDVRADADYRGRAALEVTRRLLERLTEQRVQPA